MFADVDPALFDCLVDDHEVRPRDTKQVDFHRCRGVGRVGCLRGGVVEDGEDLIALRARESIDDTVGLGRESLDLPDELRFEGLDKHPLGDQPRGVDLRVLIFVHDVEPLPRTGSTLLHLADAERNSSGVGSRVNGDHVVGHVMNNVIHRAGQFGPISRNFLATFVESEVELTLVENCILSEHFRRPAGGFACVDEEGVAMVQFDDCEFVFH